MYLPHYDEAHQENGYADEHYGIGPAHNDSHGQKPYHYGDQGQAEYSKRQGAAVWAQILRNQALRTSAAHHGTPRPRARTLLASLGSLMPP